MKEIIFIATFLLYIVYSNGQNIVEGEYFFNTEPGVGNGTPLDFTPGTDVEFNFTLPVDPLPIGFNHLYIRFKMDNGQWGMLHHKTIYHNTLSIENTITSGEYFFNTEPGLGNGSVINFAASDSVVENVNITVDGLNPGFNHLYMRFKNANGDWGLLNHKTIYVLPPFAAHTIVSGEFFVDTEPGVGNATAFEMTVPADSIAQDFILQMPELPLGPHTLYIRYKTEAGDFGMLEQRPFAVCESYGANALMSFTQDANLIHFQNESTDADSILWNFGDNTTSIADSPIHIYNEPGNYAVNLLAHNDCGENTFIQNITINGLESVSPNVVSNQGYSTLSIQGFGFVSGTIVTLFRDGSEDLLPSQTDVLNANTISTLVNFTNASLGLWNLQVEIPGGGIFVLYDAIEVNNETIENSNIHLSQVQISATRTARRSPAFATVQNNNGSDILAIPVFFRDIQDVEHINYEQTNAITEIPFFAETYQYLLNNGIVNTVMQAQCIDTETNSKFSGYFLPKIPAGASSTIPLFIKRTISGTHHCGAMMIHPQLQNSSQSEELSYDNEICWNSFAKVAFENATSLTFDEAEWNECFGSWKDSLFTTLAEMASNNAIGQMPVSMPASFAAIFTHMSQEGCVSNFPSTLTDEILNNTIARILANFTYMNDVDDIALTCPELQGLHTEDVSQQLLHDANRENEFCELAGEVGGNSFLNSAGAAAQYCKFFGNSVDPNMKYGPGNNIDQVFVNPGDLATYTITFENDSAATAPASKIVITDELDPTRFDLQSFRWAPIALTDSIFIHPNELQRHQIILTDLRPTMPYFLLSELDLDETASVVTWTFSTLDTTNLQPLDHEIGGFLPPNEDGLEGNGSVTFLIQYKNELITGDSILNDATILFDDNASITTPEWLNVIDNTAPQSEVTDLPVNTNTENFMVEWSGVDSPAGIAHFSVFVSTNDGPYLPWIIAEAGTQAMFTGVTNNIYKFYSRALDHAGNFEEAPEDPLTNYDAITQITTSVAEYNETIGLRAFPNPADDVLNITMDLPHVATLQYEITDLSGKRIVTSKAKATRSGKVKEQLNISNLAQGLYMLRVYVDDASFVEKIVIR